MSPLPDEVYDLLDKSDDLAMILDSVRLMTEAGVDLSVPAHLRIAVEGARRRMRGEITARTPPETRKAPEQRTDWVYYARLGERVKIGHSVKPYARTVTFAEQLVAVEPGGVHRERERHLQFRALRLHGEWFELAPALTAHMGALRARYVVPERAERVGNGGSSDRPTGLCSPEEIAEHFGVAPGTVYAWCSRPSVPVHRRAGGIDPDEVETYLARRGQESRPAAPAT